MKLNKTLLSLFSAVLLLGGCASNTDTDSTVPAAETAQVAPAKAKHNLWAVKGKTNTVYLLGSVHVLTPDHYPLADAYMQAYDDAERLVFEIEKDGLEPTELLKLTQQMGVYLDGSKLADHIDADDYKTIKELFPKTGLPLQMVDVMEPWLSFITISASAMEKLGYKGEHGIDSYFNNLAVKANKPVSSLESAKEQLQIMDSIPVDVQTDMLVKTLEEYDQIAADMKKLDDAWVNADGEFLADELITEIQTYPEFYDALIVKRNHNWLARIKPMLNASDDYMIVAGAAHMYGDDGLVKLLKKAGYNVTRL